MMAPLPALDPARRLARRDLIAVVRAVAGPDPVERADLSPALEHERLQPLATAIPKISMMLTDVAHGRSHGDLHPGNLAVAADSRPALWDWERWDAGLPVGFDLLHHDVQTWISVDGTSPRAAAQRLIRTASESLAPLGVPAHAAPAVAADYLIRLAARYVGDAQDEAGSRLGNVENWIVPVILDWEHEMENA